MGDARAWLASQLDPYRAVWVAAQFDPASPTHVVNRRIAPRPTLARLLPARWLAIGFVNNEEVDRWWSDPVTADLPMAPNLAALEPGDGVRALLRKQGLQWMVDFNEAVKVGMGIKIPLDNVTALQGFERAAGGRRRRPPRRLAPPSLSCSPPTATPRGSTSCPRDRRPTTPTRWRRRSRTDAPELDPLFESETAEVLPRGRPVLAEPAQLYRMQAANAASIALGLTDANALDRAPNAGLFESVRSHAMNQALWGSTLEYLLESPLAFGGHPVLEGSDLEWLRDWFCDYVRGGAALPALRIGTQPYGLLPGHEDAPRRRLWTPATSRDWLEQTLGGLHNTWRLARAPTCRRCRPSRAAPRPARSPARRRSPSRPSSAPSPTRSGCDSGTPSTSSTTCATSGKGSWPTSRPSSSPTSRSTDRPDAQQSLQRARGLDPRQPAASARRCPPCVC